MKSLLSCAYNMDNCCVELKFSDGSMIAIDTIAVENEVADNMYQRLEWDWTIYSKQLEHVQLYITTQTNAPTVGIREGQNTKSRPVVNSDHWAAFHLAVYER